MMNKLPKNQSVKTLPNLSKMGDGVHSPACSIGAGNDEGCFFKRSGSGSPKKRPLLTKSTNFIGRAAGLRKSLDPSKMLCMWSKHKKYLQRKQRRSRGGPDLIQLANFGEDALKLQQMISEVKAQAKLAGKPQNKQVLDCKVRTPIIIKKSRSNCSSVAFELPGRRRKRASDALRHYSIKNKGVVLRNATKVTSSSSSRQGGKRGCLCSVRIRSKGCTGETGFEGFKGRRRVNSFNFADERKKPTQVVTGRGSLTVKMSTKKKRTGEFHIPKNDVQFVHFDAKIETIMAKEPCSCSRSSYKPEDTSNTRYPTKEEKAQSPIKTFRELREQEEQENYLKFGLLDGTFDQQTADDSVQNPEPGSPWSPGFEIRSPYEILERVEVVPSFSNLK